MRSAYIWGIFTASETCGFTSCENLQEYFFVWNQFLFIKTIRKNAKTFYKINILAKVMSHTNEMKKNAKILNL